MAKALKVVVALLLVAALLLLGPCDGRNLKDSVAAARVAAAAAGGSSEEKATGLPVLGPVVPLPPVIPGLPPARKADKSP
ncbi:unnamed protein product [Urochloa humidicola]